MTGKGRGDVRDLLDQYQYALTGRKSPRQLRREARARLIGLVIGRGCSCLSLALVFGVVLYVVLKLALR